MLLVEKNEICIKDYVEILIMEQNYFKIKMNQYLLNVRGDHLEIYYYDQNEIRLHGTIQVIEYV
jgi:YabP family.